MSTGVQKALLSRRATLKGNFPTRKRKVRTTPRFKKPKTLRLPRNPKYPRKSAPSLPRLTNSNVLKYPLTSESAMKNIEDENTLVFVTDILANKYQIRDAVKATYKVKVDKVRTLITPQGKKKAYVRLAADVDAMDVANMIGVV
ncbi:60S ribosomal protein L23A [Coelomomyces lativittatus]|nr:60S ribosomal protein L23A [Coelomomyces lativittatus]